MHNHLCARCTVKSEDPLSRIFHQSFFLLLGLCVVVLLIK